ncbi:MAG: hypothetical protein ACOC9J_05115, partial [Persicimonas sp.]
MAVHRRVVPRSAALAGFRVMQVRDFGPRVSARADVRHEWLAEDHDLDDDPAVRCVAVDTGQPRALHFQRDLEGEAWRTAPVGQLLARLEVTDRITFIVPINPDVEVSLSVDRPVGGVPFTDSDSRVFEMAIEGLWPLATRWVWRAGLMPGQRRLDRQERRLFDHLVSGAAPRRIAHLFDLTPKDFDERVGAIFGKLGVANHANLLLAWLDEAATPDASPIDKKEKPACASDSSPSPKDGGDDTLMLRARHAIDVLLASDELSLEAVAQRLGIGVRTLQRRLSAAETTFSELTGQARRQRARE